MKNEEASQISRLNDEIRALKEKLMRQAQSGGGVVGAEQLAASVRLIQSLRRRMCVGILFFQPL